MLTMSAAATGKYHHSAEHTTIIFSFILSLHTNTVFVCMFAHSICSGFPSAVSLSHYGSYTCGLVGSSCSTKGVRFLGHNLFLRHLLISNHPFPPTVYFRLKSLADRSCLSLHAHLLHRRVRTGHQLALRVLFLSLSFSCLTQKSHHIPHHQTKPGELLPLPSLAWPQLFRAARSSVLETFTPDFPIQASLPPHPVHSPVRHPSQLPGLWTAPKVRFYISYPLAPPLPPSQTSTKQKRKQRKRKEERKAPRGSRSFQSGHCFHTN